MNTFLEMIQAVQNDLTIGDESSLFPKDTVKLAINRAKLKAEGLYKWPELNDSENFASEAGREYYNYPSDWRVDSAWRLEVDGTPYGDRDGSPLGFKDYIYERDNNFPSGIKNIWSVFGRKIFITPTPTDNGDGNCTIWGENALVDLVEDDELTIFSNSRPECNDAIVLEATAILKNKGDKQTPIQARFLSGSLLLSAEAKQILQTAWGKITQNQAKYDRDLPAFDVPDFFPRRKAGKDSNIGNF